MKKIAWQSFLNAAGAAVYTSLVATLMYNGERIFGKTKTVWGPIALLMLFILSATIVGLLILGRPIYLYLEGQKKDAVNLLLLTVFWLFIFTALMFLILSVG